MLILSEQSVEKVANRQLAFDAVKTAFVAAHRNMGRIFPVVIAGASDETNSFSVKSGCLTKQRVSGLKIGSFWAHNHHRHGIPNHSTTTVLLDEETGIAQAVVNAGYLNGLRTAAADAVATRALARRNATVLGVLGAGHQAIFDIKAVCKVRSISRILINSRTEASALRAVVELANAGIAAETANRETVCRAADILITVTTARAPLFEADWIKPGTHISAMGADQSGKQELPLELVNRARLFADLPAQSRTIGEFEAASKANPDISILSIGAVLTGDVDGRVDDDQITVFDSSGIALQDLCVAKAVLDEAVLQGLATEVDF